MPQDLLPCLVQMARFRNLIVHDYAKIDDAQVYAVLKRYWEDFDAYVNVIARHLALGEEGAHAEEGDAH